MAETIFENIDMDDGTEDNTLHETENDPFSTNRSSRDIPNAFATSQLSANFDFGGVDDEDEDDDTFGDIGDDDFSISEPAFKSPTTTQPMEAAAVVPPPAPPVQRVETAAPPPNSLLIESSTADNTTSAAPIADDVMARAAAAAFLGDILAPLPPPLPPTTTAPPPPPSTTTPGSIAPIPQPLQPPPPPPPVDLMMMESIESSTSSSAAASMDIPASLRPTTPPLPIPATIPEENRNNNNNNSEEEGEDTIRPLPILAAPSIDRNAEATRRRELSLLPASGVRESDLNFQEANFNFGEDVDEENSYADSDEDDDAVAEREADFDFGNSDEEEDYKPSKPREAIAGDSFHGALSRGQMEERGGDFVRAQEEYVVAMKLAEREDGPECMEVGVALNSIAGVQRKLHRLDDAEKSYRKALKIYESTVGPNAAETAAVLNNIAALKCQLNQYDEAKLGYQRALHIVERTMGEESPYVGVAVNNLAHLERRQGRLDEAEKLYKRALGIAEDNEPAMGDEGVRVLARTHNNIGQLYRHKGELDLSQRHYSTAVALWRAVCAPGEGTLAAALVSLAGVCEMKGESGRAKELYMEALKVFRHAKGGKRNFAAAPTLNNIARLLKEEEKIHEAERYYREALEVVERASKSDPEKHAPDLVATQCNLAGLLRKKGSLEEAGQLYQRALVTCIRRHGDDHPATAATNNNLAGLRMQQGQLGEAQVCYEKALSVSEKTYGREHPHVAVLLNNLGRCHELQGNADKAAELYKRGLAVAKAAQKAAGSNPGTAATNLNKTENMLKESMHKLATKEIGKGMIHLEIMQLKDLKVRRMRAVGVQVEFESERRQTKYLPSNFTLKWDEKFILTAPHSAASHIIVKLVGRKVIGSPSNLGEVSLLLQDMVESDSTGEGITSWYTMTKIKGKSRAARLQGKRTAQLQMRFRYASFNQ